MPAQLRTTMRSGRRVGITGLGDPLSRRLVVFCHPLPGASGFDPDPKRTRRWGIHLLTADRPGYGSSDPWPDDEEPDVDAWADDLAHWARDSIDQGDARSAADYRQTIGVVGWGVGGAYAIALARRMPERVDRLALVDVPTPDRMRERAAAGAVDIDIEDLPAGTPGRRIGQMIEDAATQGTAGAAADRRAVAREEWSRELDAIPAATLLVYRPDEPGGRRSFDATWYRRHLRATSTGIVRGGVPVVHAWGRILEHVAQDHGGIAPASR